MQRSWTAMTIAVAAVVTVVTTTSTASNRLPSSTAGYQAVIVTGATMKGITYTVAASVISALTVTLKGPASVTSVTVPPVTTVRFSTVKAHFGSNADVTCTIGAYDAVNDRTDVLCTPFSQIANTSWKLRITVS